MVNKKFIGYSRIDGFPMYKVHSNYWKESPGGVIIKLVVARGM